MSGVEGSAVAPRKRDPAQWSFSTREETGLTYAAVGEFITSASRLDSALSALVAAMTSLDDNPIAEYVTHHISTGQKLGILGVYISKGIEPRLDKAVDRAQSILSIRDTVAHGLYSRTSGRITLNSATASKAAKMLTKETEVFVDTLPALSLEADQICNLVAEVCASLRLLRRRKHPDLRALFDAMRNSQPGRGTP